MATVSTSDTILYSLFNLQRFQTQKKSLEQLIGESNCTDGAALVAHTERSFTEIA